MEVNGVYSSKRNKVHLKKPNNVTHSIIISDCKLFLCALFIQKGIKLHLKKPNSVTQSLSEIASEEIKQRYSIIINDCMLFLSARITPCLLLRTGDELDQNIDNSVCCLCQDHRENIKHLFFECCYSKEVWKGILQLMKLNRDVLYAKEEWKWIMQQSRGGPTAGVFKAMLLATMYWIWYERNSRRFNELARAPELVIASWPVAQRLHPSLKAKLWVRDADC